MQVPHTDTQQDTNADLMMGVRWMPIEAQRPTEITSEKITICK